MVPQVLMILTYTSEPYIPAIGKKKEKKKEKRKIRGIKVVSG